MPPMVSQIEVARPPPSVGSRFTTTRRIGPVEQTMTQEITELNPPRSWAARGVDGPLRASAGITVEPLGGGARSRVTFALDFQGRGIGKLLPLDVIRRIALKQAPRSYRNLKERLEGGDRRALGSAGATRPRKRRAV